MTVTINGKEEKIDGSGVSVLELLKLKNVEMPDMVSVRRDSESERVRYQERSG